MSSLEQNELHYGDNLHVMREKIPDEIADLIYLDPPFNSSRNYNLLFKQIKGDHSPAQIMAFEDTWQWSPRLYDDFRDETRNAKLFPLIAALHEILGPSEMMAYILMMAPRMLEMHRKLKATGSLYLHCDPVASHYLKIILDVVFGPQNFINEIIWKRNAAKGLATRRLPRNHDILLAYGRSPEYIWNADAIYTPYSSDLLDAQTLAQYHYIDEDGRRYQLTSLTNPNPDRPNLTYEFLGVTRVWRWTKERMQEAFAAGSVVQTSPGAVPRYKRYLDEQRGRPADDVWTDIKNIQGAAKERRGYPTQKPLALLERIIATSSNPDDVVMDPFCGCGTAIVAAERMDRKWIGIDVTYLAIAEVIHRLETERKADKPLEYRLVGTPTDALGAQKLFEESAPQSHKPYEQFCVALVKGEYREQKGADRGIDGVIHLWDIEGKLRNIVIQVKGGNALTLSAVRDFGRVIERENAVIGLMISQKEPTKEMRLEAEKMGYADWHSQHKYPRYQLRTVKELLEDPRNLFEIPDSYRVDRGQGVGKKIDANQGALEI